MGPLQKILLNKKANESSKSKPVEKVAAPSKAPPVRKDPYLEQEEMELARLSKLLGIDKSKSHALCRKNTTPHHIIFVCVQVFRARKQPPS